MSEDLNDIGHRVSQTILNRQIPIPEDIAQTLGESAVPPYFFMHALFYRREQTGVRGILEPVRRDSVAIQLHSYESAFKPDYRFYDKKIPSGYRLSEREKRGDVVHDIGEDFGRDILGALIVNDVITSLFGAETGSDADILTNKSALLLKPLQEELVSMQVREANSETAYQALSNLNRRVKVSEQEVLGKYQEISDALKYFGYHITRDVDYIQPNQKAGLTEVIANLARSVQERTREGIRPSDLEERMHTQYGLIMQIIDNGKYSEVEEGLVLPDESKYLATLKKTLYDLDFISKIAQRVKEDAGLASNNGNSGNDYLAPFMEKLAEITDTVAKFDKLLPHAISIFRKSRIVVRHGVALVNNLHEESHNYDRLRRGVDYLFRNLDAQVEINRADAITSVRKLSDTSYEIQMEKYGIMQAKMNSLRPIIKEMNRLTPHNSRKGLLRMLSLF